MNNPKNQKEQEAIPTPQYPIFQWVRGLLDRRHEACDMCGDITKKVRMEVPDFKGKGHATQFVN